MTLSNAHRFNSHQYDRFAIDTLTDLTEFQGLFANTPPVSVRSRQEGDLILDSYTGTGAILWHDKPANKFRWAGDAGSTIRVYPSDAALPANRFVKFVGNRVNLAGLGEAAHGITMHATADEDEDQYTLAEGTYLVELSDPDNAPSAGQYASSDADGKLVGIDAPSVLWIMGWITIPDVLIGAIHYGVVEFRIPAQTDVLPPIG